MNDIGEKGWSRVSVQMVLGRGEKRGPARYRAVVSLGLCSQGVRWKPCIEGGLAPAGHIVSYSVQHSRSSIMGMDPHFFGWALEKGLTYIRATLEEILSWSKSLGLENLNELFSQPNTRAFTFLEPHSAQQDADCILVTWGLRAAEGADCCPWPPSPPSPHHHMIPVVHQGEEKSKCLVLLKTQVLVSESTACQNVENAAKVLRGKIIAINTY